MIRHFLAHSALWGGVVGMIPLWAQDARDAFVGTWRLEGPCKERVIKSSEPMENTGSGSTSGTLTIRKDPQNPKRLILLSRMQGSSSGAGGSASASIEDSLVADVISSTELRIPSQTGVMGETREGTAILQNGKLVTRLRVRMSHDHFYYEGESECSYTPSRATPPRIPPGQPIPARPSTAK
ncbi:MAG: hypothetical protein NZZ60_00545 [Bacteroidia bacterium]|nr:hypothetical protein [Bacteroidia bacterium]MDW8417678.1 hypothetical protein [Bacteroidia bacterium]